MNVFIFELTTFRIEKVKRKIMKRNPTNEKRGLNFRRKYGRLKRSFAPRLTTKTFSNFYEMPTALCTARHCEIAKIHGKTNKTINTTQIVRLIKFSAPTRPFTAQITSESRKMPQSRHLQY